MGEIVDDAFISVARAGCVQIHSGDARLREEFANLLLKFFGTCTTLANFTTAAFRTLLRNEISTPAVVACQCAEPLMVCQRHIAMLAFRHPSTALASEHRSETAPILKQNDLLTSRQCLTDSRQKVVREHTDGLFAVVPVLHIYHLDVWKLDILVA